MRYRLRRNKLLTPLFAALGGTRAAAAAARAALCARARLVRCVGRRRRHVAAAACR